MARDAYRRAGVCDFRVGEDCHRCHIYRAHETRGSDGVTRRRKALLAPWLKEPLVATWLRLEETLTNNRRWKE